jgi:hypothetical protein
MLENIIGARQWANVINAQAIGIFDHYVWRENGVE